MQTHHSRSLYTRSFAAISLLTVASAAVLIGSDAWAQTHVSFTPGEQLNRNSTHPAPRIPSTIGVTFTPAAPAAATATRPPVNMPPHSPSTSPATADARVAARSAATPDSLQEQRAPLVHHERTRSTSVSEITGNSNATLAQPTALNAPAPTAATHPTTPSTVGVVTPSTPSQQARTITHRLDQRRTEDVSPNRCSVTQGLQTIALDEAELRATQILLAANEHSVVAHVNLSRPGSSREGLQFPSGKLLTFATSSPDSLPRVHRTIGVQPGAAIALSEEGEVFVLSPARVASPRTGRTERPDLQWTVLRSDGSAQFAFRTIPSSSGYQIDSQPVSWRGGWSVVLGEAVNPAPAHNTTFEPIRERVYSFDRSAMPSAPPWILTEAQRPESVSRFRVGLGRVAGGDSLAAVFADDHGLALRQFTVGEPHDPPTRIASTTAWSPEITAAGDSVVFREDGFNGLPARLRMTGFREGPIRELGVGWEPLAAVHHSATIVAGTLLSDHGRMYNALLTEAHSSGVPQVIEVARGTAAGDNATQSPSARFDQALDVAFVATQNGALLAWLEATNVDDPAGTRQLVVARVECRD